MMTLAFLARLLVALGFLALLVRLSGKRGLRGINAFDLLIAVLLGDVAGMTALGQVALPEGLLALGVLVWLHVAWGAILRRSPQLSRWAWGVPEPLVQQRHVHPAALQRYGLTTDAVGSLLREAGAPRLGDVQACQLEPDNGVSVQYYADACPLPAAEVPVIHPSVDKEEQPWRHAA